MKIQLNGETHEIPTHATLAHLVERLNLEGRRYAIEVNETLVPRSQHKTYVLHEGDKVEIVQAIGGG